MKNILFIVCLFVVGCSVPANQSNLKPRAAYLVQGNGVLTDQELQAHPEVSVTSNFGEFRKYAQNRIALWIDKNALNLVQDNWLDSEPQAYYPIVLVGNNDTLSSFRDTLKLCCFSGPAVDLNQDKLSPGFSVIFREKGDAFPRAVFLQGFKQTPKATDILEITNGLLDGTWRTIPTP